MLDLGAGDEPVIDLVELIAVHRIVEEEGEVREQIEVVADAVGDDLGRARCRCDRCHSSEPL